MQPGLVAMLYEVADDRDLPAEARGEDGRMAWRMRARHRLREPETTVDRAGDDQIVALLRACRSARDRLIVLLLARAGCGVGRCAGCGAAMCTCWWIRGGWAARSTRAHLHVVRREDNPNGAWAKSRRQRVVPLDFLVVQAVRHLRVRAHACARGRRQRLRVRQPVPRDHRRADAPGRDRAS